MILVNNAQAAIYLHSIKLNIWPGEVKLPDSLRSKIEDDKTFKARSKIGSLSILSEKQEKEIANAISSPDLSSQRNEGHLEAANEILHVNAVEAIKAINLITSLGTLEIIAEKELRKGVKKAAQERINNLTAK